MVLTLGTQKYVLKNDCLVINFFTTNISKKSNTFLPFEFFPGRNQTLDLRMKRRVFYHYATTAGRVKLKSFLRPLFLKRHDTQHNDIQHNDFQHNGASYDTQHK